MIKLLKTILSDLITYFSLNYNYYMKREKIRLSQSKRNIVVLGIPHHFNLGDQAIVVAEKQFIIDSFPDCELILLSENDFEKSLLSVTRQLDSNDVVMYHGGGNLGSLYPYAERRRRFAVQKMRHHRLISFPQSVFFENNISGKYELIRSQRVYKRNPNFVVTVREKFSQGQMQALFPEVSCILTPDIVFYLRKANVPVDTKHEGVLLVLRKDMERVIDDSFQEKLIKMLKETCDLSVTDMLARKTKHIDDTNRSQILKKKFREFQLSDIVITDRLHGMLFAILAHRPCVVFVNNNHKIKSMIETWLPSYNQIVLLENPSVQDVDDALKAIRLNKPNPIKIDEADFEPLLRAINTELHLNRELN